MDDDKNTQRVGGIQGTQADRLLSPFEVVFWRLAQSASLNVTTIAAVHGPLSESALVAGLQALRERHPLLQVAISDDDGTPKYRSKNVPEIPLEIVDRGELDCVPVVEHELNHPIDPERGPLARCTWIRHDASSHHLLVTFHHAIGDGMSGVFLMRDLVQAAAMQLRGLESETEGGGRPILPPLHDSQPMDLRLPSHAQGLRAVWNQARFVARVATDNLRFRPPDRPRPGQPCPLVSRTTQLICRTLEASTVDQIVHTARHHATTVHGALSAAICLATVDDNSSTAPMSVKHRSPVNMRELLAPQAGEDVGMFASMAFYRGRVTAEDDFWILARSIRTSLKAQIDNGVPSVLIGMLPRLYRMIRGDRLTVDEFGSRWQQHTPSTTGLTNLGRIEIADDFGPLDLRTMYFAVSPGGLGDCACTATTYRGKLHWNFLFAAPYFSKQRAERITDDAVERLMRAIGQN